MKNNNVKLAVWGSALLVATVISSALHSFQSDPMSVSKPIKNTVQKSIKSKSGKQSLEDLYASSVQALFQSRALSATLFGVSEQLVGEYYADQLEDYSPKAEAELRARLHLISEQIATASLTKGSSVTEENRRVMANLTRYFAGHKEFPFGYIDTWMGMSPFIVNQINGPLIDAPRYMQSDQKITSKKDAEDYLERLNQFDLLIKSVELKFQSDISNDWIPPKVILQGALRYLEEFIAMPAEQHPLVKAFVEKLMKLEQLNQQEKSKLIRKAADTTRKKVYPGYRAIAETVRRAISKARNESGIWAQPNGATFYQDTIRQLGDSELSAGDIHQIGLNEVERISKEMHAILQEQGYAKGSVGKRMAALNEESRFLYPDSKEGRAQLLQDLNGYIDAITQKMPKLFRTQPPYQVEVRAFPVEIQEGAPGGQYTPPAVDGSKPGIYWINLRDMKANPKFGLKTLTYHEANPGHHWQIALNLAQESLPFLRRVAPYNAYVEGWALYSENVAAEMGMYQDDPFGDLGRLQAELFRAVRLVVDTGLHHKRWTREQAIDYMSKTTGTAQSDVISEIERYMTWPGQALGYKMGMLKILELRANAKKVLGNKFDLAEFHDLVLLGGAVPMIELERKVAQWIKEAQAE